MWPRRSHSPSTRAVRWPSPACWLGPREGFAAECPVQAVVSAAAGAYAAAAVSLFTLGLLAMESHVRPAWRHGHFPVHDVEGSTRRWEQCPAAMRQALARHGALIAAAIAQHAGGAWPPRARSS